MKLATYRSHDELRVGAVINEETRILDLGRAAETDGGDAGTFRTMLDLIDAGPAGLDAAASLSERYAEDAALTVPVNEIVLEAPLPVPRQIRDFSVFPGHIRQAPVGMRKLQARMAGQPIPDLQAADSVPELYRSQPIYYLSNRFSVAGPDATVTWPGYSRFMDFELELAAVIGRAGKNIGAAEAAGHIFGYTIYNDFSARDAQLIEMQGFLGPAKGKSFDGGNVIGPWIATLDEIADPDSLEMRARVNGALWSQGSTADMLHSFEDMIAFVSRDETIHAGEIFGSGTIGNGCGLEQDRYLEDGDLVELEVESIGVLRNRVVRADRP